MRLLILVAIALALGGALIWVAHFEPGYVLLSYGRWSLETSLIVFMAMFILLVVAGYFLVQSVVFLGQSSRKWSSWRESKANRLANRALTRGLISLEEGRWVEAERVLIRYASNSETPLLHYLAAARAAQKQDASERRDNYLKLAQQTTEGADIAVGVLQSELQLLAGQKEQALVTLTRLREIAPKHPYVLQLLNDLYQQMDAWQEAQAILPDLRKTHVLQHEAFDDAKQQVTQAQLNVAIAKQDWPQVSEIWQAIPAKSRQSAEMLIPYVAALKAQHEDTQAASLIEQAINRKWDEKLSYHYGLLNHADKLKSLKIAEDWLAKQGESSCLLLTLGYMASNAELWEKAEQYLQASLRYEPSGETYKLLAAAQMVQGDKDAAILTYQQGLEWMLSN